MYVCLNVCFDMYMCFDIPTTLDHYPQLLNQTLIGVAMKGVCKCN